MGKDAMMNDENALERLERLENAFSNLSIQMEFALHRNKIYQKMLEDLSLEFLRMKFSETRPQNIDAKNVKSVFVNREYTGLFSSFNYILDMLHIIFDAEVHVFPYKTGNIDFDLACIVGLKDGYENMRLFMSAIKRNRSVLFVEDGLVSCILPISKNGKEKYKKPHSLLLDSMGAYYDAYHPAELEMELNSAEELTDEQRERAKRLIDTLVANKITKYNHQPIHKVDIGKRAKKVLIVDQVWGDASIDYGMATDDTFRVMLGAAIKENPDADIIIKTHPDTNGTFHRRHYSEVPDGVYKIDYDINPYSLLEAVQKVYVCTSQMGFEALLCGKEVHAFGMPFYAGWGVTIDAQTCDRRTRTRTLEDIFYMTYIRHTRYVSYETQSTCELEDTIRELISLRDEYFAEYNMDS